MTPPVFVADDVEAVLNAEGLSLSPDSLEPTEVGPGKWLIRCLGRMGKEFVCEAHAVCVRGEWSVRPLPGASKWRRADVQAVGGGVDPVGGGR